MNPSRIPLRFGSGAATFLLATVGLLTANLSPFMMTTLEESLGIAPVDSGNLITLCLLATAVSCILITRVAEGPKRRQVARIGLILSTIGFLATGFSGGISWLAIGGLVLGGIGTGVAIAAGGAALAAFENPNRVSGLSGLTNRTLIGISMLIIPVFGISLVNVFLALTLFSLAALILVLWLPNAPLADVETTAVNVPDPREVNANSVPSRTVTIAGFAVLIMFAIWAIGEDSIWVMGLEIGTAQAGLSAEEAGFALGASTFAGLAAAALFSVVGNRLGRVIPIIVIFLIGAGLKLLVTTTADPTMFLWSFIGWNTVYTAGFMYFIAIAAALDPNGKWSGPVMGVYLVGSAFAPSIGAWVGETFGIPAVGWFTAAISLILIVPTVFAAWISVRVERDQTAVTASGRAANTLRASAS